MLLFLYLRTKHIEINSASSSLSDLSHETQYREFLPCLTFFMIDNTRLNQKFCNILVTRGTIWQLRKLSPRSWKWLTTVRFQARQIWPEGYSPDILKKGFGIHDFRLTWHCLIVKVLATWATFFESFTYCAVINLALYLNSSVWIVTQATAS